MSLANLDDWCEVKKGLHSKCAKRKLYVKEAEVWWASLGLNLGVESSGKGKLFARPVAVLKKVNQRAFLVLPLTSKDKSKSKHYHKLGVINGRSAYASLSQARLIDACRMQNRVVKLSEKKLKALKNAFVVYNNLLEESGK